MECLFHEKPFEGINGSGKHVNFSIGNSTEGNLLLPGDTPARERPVPRVLRRRHPGGAQVRRPAARVGRLGHQRPPARRQRGAAGHHLDLPRRPADRRVRPDRQGRRHQLQGEGHADHRRRHPARRCPTDPGDRNRTSPFAFTGNRFEFRAPGSLQSIAGPMVTINTILAEALDYIATELETARRRRHRLQRSRCRRCSRRSSPSTAAWSSTATATPTTGRSRPSARGLPNLRTTARRAARADHRRGDGAVRATTACSATARCTAATRSPSSSTR